MPTYMTGNMWTRWGDTNLFCITTCNTIRKSRRLVMGAGIALEARRRIEGIDSHLAELITSAANPKVYGLLIYIASANAWWLYPPQHIVKQTMGIFQVKREWWKSADLDVIRRSADDLINSVINHDIPRVDINSPGTGRGGLPMEAVQPIVEEFPDNVHVWTYK